MSCVVCGKEVAVIPDWKAKAIIEQDRGRPFSDDEPICFACCEKVAGEILHGLYMPVIDRMGKLANRSQLTTHHMRAAADALSCEHRHLQAELILFIIGVMRIIGERAGNDRYTDPRNEYAYAIVRDMIVAVRNRI